MLCRGSYLIRFSNGEKVEPLDKSMLNIRQATTSVYRPSLAEFRELAAGEANLIPVYREFAADLETPVSVYLKLMSGVLSRNLVRFQ